MNLQTANNFNSSMVRLKAFIPSIETGKMILFQFLNGAIKSIEGISCCINSREFQFLNGAIKSTTPESYLYLDYYFNSSMGAIKSLIRLVLRLHINYFNSSMVRLKALHRPKWFCLLGISIPQWCD